MKLGSRSDPSVTVVRNTSAGSPSSQQAAYTPGIRPCHRANDGLADCIHGQLGPFWSHRQSFVSGYHTSVRTELVRCP